MPCQIKLYPNYKNCIMSKNKIIILLNSITNKKDLVLFKFKLINFSRILRKIH